MSQSPDQHQAQAPGLDTFPRLLMHHAKVRPGHIAMREKDLGIWQTWTWSQVADEVRALAAGLAAMGFKRGDKLAIIGDNRPRLYWGFAAAQCLGGVPVPLYQDSVAEEMAYVLDDADVRFALVEDQEQTDKMYEVKEQYEALEAVIYEDPKGMRDYDKAFCNYIDDVQTRGREFMAQNPDYLDGEIAKGDNKDVSVILYTSGTTGKPKGVCQTHHAFIESAAGGAEFDGLTENDSMLAYLPMAWVGDHLFSYAQALVTGFTVNCPESAETVMTDMREIGPTYYFAPPRVFENLLTQVMVRMQDASAIKRRMFDYFMDVARRCGAELLAGSSDVSTKDRILYQIGNFLVYGPLRNVLGMSKLRIAYTAGAAIGPDLFRFYRSLGINLKQLYGSTETCAYVCLQPNGDVKLDTVGTPAPKVEIKIADNGEVLVKGPMMFAEYYKRPEATTETMNEEGYFLTGDAGFLDEDGHLKIIDRAKDVGKLSSGAMFAPNYIENKLKFFPHVKEAVAFGHDRDQVCAFINIDLESVGNWAERQGLAYSGYTDLAGKEEVYQLILECVNQVNEGLVDDPMLSESQVHRFLVLHKELDPDDDELTRTRKVRRNFIAEKYHDLVDALYSDVDQVHTTTEVKYEDGRRGKIEADIRIWSATTHLSEPMKKAS